MIFGPLEILHHTFSHNSSFFKKHFIEVKVSQFQKSRMSQTQKEMLVLPFTKSRIYHAAQNLDFSILIRQNCDSSILLFFIFSSQHPKFSIFGRPSLEFPYLEFSIFGRPDPEFPYLEFSIFVRPILEYFSIFVRPNLEFLNLKFSI